MKANKRGEYESVSAAPVNENAAARVAIAVEMAAPTKMSNRRLILQIGTAKEKAKLLKDVMMDLTRDNNAETVPNE